jgi:magnesium chelatase subunit D
MSPPYPFSALVGQESMKLALLLNAVNPRLGGVLIRGQKGTAKSTAARGLSALLPPIRVVEGCRFGCEPTTAACADCADRQHPLPSVQRAPAFVELPIGATEDRVLGTLDLERAIQLGERHFDSGLLARAHRGLLYVDEVNLLPDHLVDALLDAAAMGTNTVEREGVSFSHPASFVLVGTMNPEEGDLRPQLLDRFALAVDVVGTPDRVERAEVVRRRIAYEADPVAFGRRWDAAEQAERARVLAARERLPRVQVPERLLELIARICVELEVDGLRADVVMYKTAATLAAYGGRLEATVDDVRQAAELALPHRRRRQPFDQPGLDRDHLDQIINTSPCGGRRPEGPGEGALGGGDPASEPDQLFEIGPAPSISAPPLPPPARPGGPQASLGRARHAPPRIEGAAGRHVRAVLLDPDRPRSLDVLATVRTAAPYQVPRGRPARGPLRLEHHDVRVKLRQTADRTCTLFVVDASGSMAARRRMAAAKGAVLSLLLDAYQRRDLVGLIAFRGTRAELLLPPTTSVDQAHARLRDLPTGGRTPLAAGLRLADATLARQAGRGLLVLVSDGRANVSIGANDPFTEAVAIARAIRARGVTILVVDTEDGQVRLGLARRVCEAAGGSYLRLSDQPLASAVRRFQSAPRAR